MPWSELAPTYAKVILIGSVLWAVFVGLLAWRQR